MTPSLSQNRLDPEDLREHAAWLRRLARALALDDASADDLVQDAFGAAMAARRPIRDLRAFLGGAVRRRSAEVRRTELRRRRREESFAGDRELALPGAGEAAERVETIRILLDELQHLPAAQRDALTLRYVDGLEPADIAARAGLAPATVRAHVSRGLAALRERLDRRCGGRSCWTAAFAPWFCASVPDATTGTGIETAVLASARTHLTGTLGLALISGVSLMSIKIVAGALVPIALLGLWFGLDRSGEPTAALDARRAAPAGTDDATPARVAPTDPERRETVGGESLAPRSGAAAADPRYRVEGRVVDALTGEPVPSMALRLQIASSDHGRLGQAFTQDGGADDPHASLDEQQIATYRAARGTSTSTSPSPDAVEVETDAEGAFSTEQELPAGTMIVVEQDDLGAPPVHPRSTGHAFPFDGPIPVHVGPTFRFSTTLPGEVSESSLRARFVADRGSGFRPLETRLRAGALPWARFPFSVTRLEGEGPWTVEVSDENGLWLAKASVARTTGVEPVPVPLDFRALGALEFAVSRDDGAISPILCVDVEGVAGGEAQRVYLERGDAPVARGHAGFLEPGAYRWTAGPERGEAEVVAGEVTEVTVDVSYGGATFDAEVTIDASAVTDEDIRSSRFAVVDVDDFSNAFPVEPQRAAGDPPGFWRIVLEDLPEGTWSLVPMTGFAPVRWTPERVLLEVGRTPEVLVALPRGAVVSVRLTVRDAETMEPIPGAEAAWNTGGVDYVMLTANEAGGIRSPGVPEDEESHVLVRAPGYRMACARVVPIDDGRRVEVELERGWRGLVRIMWTDDFSLVSDVEVVVDGASAGFTDENGLLWIDGEAPPELIELGDGAPTVVMSPFDPPGMLPPDPMTGWTFLVRRP